MGQSYVTHFDNMCQFLVLCVHTDGSDTDASWKTMYTQASYSTIMTMGPFLVVKK